MATIQLVPGSYILMGKYDDTASAITLNTVKQYLDNSLTRSDFSNGSTADRNDETYATTSNLTTKWNTGSTKTIKFACYFTSDVYTEMSGHSMEIILDTISSGTSVTLDSYVLGTTYTWYQFNKLLLSVGLNTGETVYGFCGSFVVPSNLTGSTVSSLNFRIKMKMSGTQYAMDYLPVYFRCYVNLAAYKYSTVYVLKWNTTSDSLGPISPGGTKTITCTLFNKEITNSYAASTSGRIYISAVGCSSSGAPTIVLPNTDGSCWLNKNGTTYPSALTPVNSGSGNYTGLISTDATVTSSATSTYVAPQATKTFTISVKASSLSTQRRYYKPYIVFKCVGASSNTTETMTDYFYSNGVTPSGSYKLRSFSNYRVLDFQTDVENAGSASVTSTGTQPILTTNYNANYVGHLAYDGSTAALSPRFKCIDESKTIITANEYVSSGPTPIPTVLRTCSSCGHVQNVAETLTSWVCSSCGATNFVRVGGSTLVMAINGDACVTCGDCNNCLSDCPSGISVLGPNLIENADMCTDCNTCFDAGLNTVCPVDVKFFVESPLLDL